MTRSWRTRRGLTLIGIVAVVTMLGGLTSVSIAAAGPAHPKDPGSGPWIYATDTVALPAFSNNGGSASGVTEVPEECDANPPTGTTQCGRGEFGGIEPFGEALLNNLDAPNNISGKAVTFACPTSATSNTPATGTTTGPTSSSPPAVMEFPGSFTGGNSSGSDNVSGDTQCYSPYVTCTSATSPNGFCSAAGAGSNNKPGNVYKAATTDSCTGTGCLKRALEASVYIAPVSPNGSNTAGSACSGHILAAGGVIPSSGASFVDTNTAELYDPRATINGVANGSFNTWATSGTTLGTARDTMAVAVLNDGRILFSGGSNSSGPSSAYDLYDPTTCSFQSVTATMNSPRYDFSTAVFQPSGNVLACGGAYNSSYAATASCEIFQPGTYSSAGTWTTTTAMSTARSGDFEQTLPATGNNCPGGGRSCTQIMVMEAPGTSLTGISEECGDLSSASPGCGSHIANYQPDPNYSTGNTPDPSDVSHDLIGPPPNPGSLPDPTSGLAGTVGSSAPAVASGGFAGLTLACGGFGNSSLVPRTCEYYVPYLSANPPTTSSVTCSSTAGPDWCASSTGTAGAVGNFDMQRERAYFALQEVPPCSATACTGDLAKDRVLATGGYYGSDTTGNYLTRKNLEYLNES
jgi:hypothetical protein